MQLFLQSNNRAPFPVNIHLCVMPFRRAPFCQHFTNKRGPGTAQIVGKWCSWNRRSCRGESTVPPSSAQLSITKQGNTSQGKEKGDEKFHISPLPLCKYGKWITATNGIWCTAVYTHRHSPRGMVYNQRKIPSGRNEPAECLNLKTRKTRTRRGGIPQRLPLCWRRACSRTAAAFIPHLQKWNKEAVGSMDAFWGSS